MSLAEVTMTVIRYVISFFLSFDITVTSAQTVHQIINDYDQSNEFPVSLIVSPMVSGDEWNIQIE